MGILVGMLVGTLAGALVGAFIGSGRGRFHGFKFRVLHMRLSEQDCVRVLFDKDQSIRSKEQRPKNVNTKLLQRRHCS